MNEKPIIFSNEMVRAILSGQKTQTRRIIKPQPRVKSKCPATEMWFKDIQCRYGKPGDRLWVREAWNFISDEIIVLAYRADDETQIDKWRSPILMPREASRITLEIIDVRVERLQEIKAIEVISEGIQFEQHAEFENGGLTPCDEIRAWQMFADGWDKLNAKRGFSWDSNPWVGVIEFKKI